MSHRFKDRGYSDKLASTIPRDSLHLDSTNRKICKNNKYSLSFSNVPIFSTPYSSKFTKLKSIVTKYLLILLNYPVYHEILSIRSVSRRAPTLGSSLSPSLFPHTQSWSNWLHFKGNFECGIKGCNYCRHIKKGKLVQSCINGKTFDILSFINCNTRFLVYLITCEVCHIQYVGCTTRRLKDRLHNHLYDGERNRSTNVAKHWNLNHFKDISNLFIQGIKKIVVPNRGGDRFRALCKCKFFWIFSLHTRISSIQGLHFEWDVSQWDVTHYLLHMWFNPLS